MEKTAEKFPDRLKKRLAGFGRTLFTRAIPAFAVGLLCAMAALPFGAAPLGVAVACAADRSKGVAISVYLGALAGYIIGGREVLLYIAGLMLSVPIRIFFAYILRAGHRSVGSMLAAGVSLACLYTAAAAKYGFLTFDLVLGAAGVGVGTLFCYFALHATDMLFSDTAKAHGATYTGTLGIILLLSAMLIPAAPLTLYGLSFARAAGVMLTLVYACYGSSAKGALCATVVMSVLAIGAPEKISAAAACAVAAALAGLSGRPRRRLAGAIFCAVGAAVCFAAGPGDFAAAFAGEAAGGAAVFILLPERLVLRFARCLLVGRDRPDVYETVRFKEQVSERLGRAARSLDEISAALADGCPDGADADIRQGVKSVIEHTCRYCRRTAVCWGGKYSDTAGVFDDAAKALETRGYLDASDLPDWFADRCADADVMISRLNTMANERALIDEKDRQLSRNRRVMAAQYASLGAYVSEICEDVCAMAAFDDVLAARLRGHLTSRLKCEYDLIACYDARGALHVDLCLPENETAAPDTLADAISEGCGRRLACDDCRKRDGVKLMRFSPAPRLALNVSAACLPAPGEAVCGDSYAVFRASGSRQMLALADGMGSGEGADRISRLTVGVAKYLLSGGFSPDKACRLINTTLLLGGEGQNFSTLDLAIIDLCTGDADFYKLGAAPTIVIRKGQVYEVFCKSVPAGLMTDSRAQHKSCRLRPGDVVLMLSDGVDINDELLHACRKFWAEPKALCSAVVGGAQGHTSPGDDMTALAAVVTKAPPERKKNKITA